MNPILNALESLKNNTGFTHSTVNEGVMDNRSYSPGIISNVRKLNPNEDSMRGKHFVYADGPQKGMAETVDYTIENNGKYSVVFKSGIQMLVEDLNIRMYENEQYNRMQKKLEGLDGAILPPVSNINVNKKLEGLEVENIDRNIAPKFIDDPPLPEGFEKVEVKQLQKQQSPQNKKAQEKNPLFILYDKMKKDLTKISFDVNLSIPSSTALSILLDSFENDKKELVNYMLNNNIELIKDELMKEIYKIYNIQIEDDNNE